jgi:choline-sulfatase
MHATYIRRDFLKLSGLGLLGVAGQALAAGEQRPRPNMLVVITDQQHAGMLSCTGNPWVKTPNMDRLAKHGVRFEKAYCANPVCVPSRFSMFTGTLPSAIAMESNGDDHHPVSEKILHNAMGNVLRRAGYQTMYAGKIHLPGQPGVRGRIEAYGFERLAPQDPNGRDEAVGACVQFLQQKHAQPFLLVASLINPHDICYMAINAYARHEGGKIKDGPQQQCLAAALQKPAGVSEQEFFEKHGPPLPSNYEIPAQEPEALSVKKGQRSFRAYTRENWSDQDWRMHRWAYARLTERVDAQIGRILDALEQAGLDKNTLVVFTSDHGDMDAAHRLEHKSMPYEEAIHVPFIVSWKGVTPGGTVDRERLVSTGLDLIPTLCEFAGIPVPTELPGRGVRALAEGRVANDWRKTLVIENTHTRILHMGRSKYVICHAGENREQFVDLDKDPGEMKNMAADPAYKTQVEQGRKALQEWYAKSGLALDRKYIVSD